MLKMTAKALAARRYQRRRKMILNYHAKMLYEGRFKVAPGDKPGDHSMPRSEWLKLVAWVNGFKP